MEMIKKQVGEREYEELSSKVKKQAEEIAYLKKLIDSLPASIYWKDHEGVYLGRNHYAKKAMRDLNLEPDDERYTIEGKTDFDLFPFEIANHYREHDLSVMQTGQEMLVEEEVKTSDGRIRTQLSSKKPLYNEAGEVIGIVGNTIDIAAKKELEALQKQQIIIQEKILLLKQLAGTIAHEVRTPLAGLLILTQKIGTYIPGLLEAYQKGVKKQMVDHSISNEELERLAAIAPRAKHYVKSALSMVDMLLMNIREQMLIKQEDIKAEAITDCIQSALDYFPFEEDETALIECNLKDNFYYHGLSQLTQHILFNLLSNALYAIKRAQKGKIYIQLKQTQNNHQLIFGDTALGIKPEELEQLFSRFHTTRPSGTGLGLAFCKMVMEAYGGKIECHSVYGEYTEFVLTFPKVE